MPDCTSIKVTNLQFAFMIFDLRLLTSSDAEIFYKLIEHNRPRLDFFSGTVARTMTLSDTSDYLKEIMGKIEKKLYLPYFFFNKEDHSIVGFIDLKNIDWTIPKGELGYFVNEDHANQGIGTEMLNTFSEFCFRHYGLQKLFLRTHESNYPSRKIAERCGFEIEGILRRDYKTTSGELVDLVYYGKLNNLKI